MAASLSFSEEDLSCPVCCEIFRDPVVLQCSHSFCKTCLQQYWTKKLSGRDCPLCRCESSTDDPVVSLTLKNLCDSYVKESCVRGAAEGEETGELCNLHGEKLKLFCLEDCQPICVVCHTSRKHKDHECCPIGEAVLDFKAKLKAALKPLKGKWEAFDKARQDYEKTAAHIKTQARQTEEQIKAEFEKLHHFLRVEEEVRVTALKEEEEAKSLMMKAKINAVERTMASLSDTIRALEEEIQVEDITLLHKCKATMKRAHPTIPELKLGSGVLINVASYLGSLTYKVWMKMLEIVRYTPVTLDPNTAAPWLILSEDLTTVADSEERQHLPDNPERFTLDTAVLGTAGFSSGSHSWDVEVGDNEAWVLGVVKESAQRKEKVPSILKNGYLSMYYYHKMYFAGTSPLTRLNLKKRPQIIRVTLDWDRGKVTFSDPSNHTQIYMFKHTFTEMVFPYFWVGSKECPLRILPLEMSVILEHSS
ncbi:E3 ubiquitin-protein ligase TRIM35-like [Anguilla rostrata]|uniref:E3 ubiquitin-protein ligase TRIM35-like n=1 Tax=Anguilla rostrata TaxID=7938 RepID=UPI0030CF7836